MKLPVHVHAHIILFRSLHGFYCSMWRRRVPYSTCRYWSNQQCFFENRIRYLISGNYGALMTKVVGSFLSKFFPEGLYNDQRENIAIDRLKGTRNTCTPMRTQTTPHTHTYTTHTHHTHVRYATHYTTPSTWIHKRCTWTHALCSVCYLTFFWLLLFTWYYQKANTLVCTFLRAGALPVVPSLLCLPSSQKTTSMVIVVVVVVVDVVVALVVVVVFVVVVVSKLW